jgi:hypothetical protein
MPEGVVQNTSPLPGGRHTLVKPIQYGQEEMEIVLVELISLRGKDIKFCIGCMSCQTTGATHHRKKSKHPPKPRRLLSAGLFCYSGINFTVHDGLAEYL